MRHPLLLLGFLAGCGHSAAPEGAPLPEADGTPAHTDGIPAALSTSSDGTWTARVMRGGALVVDGPQGKRRVAEAGVLHVVDFSPTGRHLAYSQQTEFPDADLHLLDLQQLEGDPLQLTDWPGPEDRPLFSPDGTQLAFVSGRTGWASVYVLDLDGGAGAEPRQLTNVGVEDLPRRPGEPPEGFVPPPASNFQWTAAGLSWEAEGEAWSVPAAELSP